METFAKPPITIAQAVAAFLDNVRLARSEKTATAYRHALNAFQAVLDNHQLPCQSTPAQNLPEDAIAWFAAFLKDKAPATERMYLTATAGLYEFLAAERLASPNLPRLRMLIHQRARKQGQRLPQFPRSDIELVIDYAINLAQQPVENEQERLINLRDRAFLVILADSGLRVHEACKLRRGDIDWHEGRALIIGKGDKQAVVRFSHRSLEALKLYLSARAGLDGKGGRALTALPLFARHDRGAGSKVKPMTTTTGRAIVEQRVVETLGSQAAGAITPHSFRHYFVTKVLRGTGNLKLAQELARHQNIAITQRYAHLSDDELDKGYYEVFEQGK